ncbi:unnamed protein product [Chilo suppressalis]|uniref:Uncharacterized protein n=1 Tax=Chilo suppressalis TaxID=168631 RepID=A0ABN8B5W3_CHISP|nr:unnamed protein product [Chilo suppressalis]
MRSFQRHVFWNSREIIFLLFSSSTQRWQLLREKTGKNLKRLSDTRWSSHYESVKVVKENIETVVSSLEHFQDTTKANLDTRSGACLLLLRLFVILPF